MKRNHAKSEASSSVVKDLIPNMVYDFHIHCNCEDGHYSEHGASEASSWFARHGHTIVHQENGVVTVRGDSYKIPWILADHFPDLEVDHTLFSEPVGLKRGDWVVLGGGCGIVGTVAFEYGSERTPDTSANVSVGSATWTGPAKNMKLLSDFDDATAARLREIGIVLGENWEKLTNNFGDAWAEMLRLRQEVLDIVDSQNENGE